MRSTAGVYSFFIGDGACRLNGGMELACHLIEDYTLSSIITIFLYNNGIWAIEDNLVGGPEAEHKLGNFKLYELLGHHANFSICETDLDLRATLSHLSKKTEKFIRGEHIGEINVIVMRNMNDLHLEPVLGNLDKIGCSAEISFLRDTLGYFAHGCKWRVPT